MLICVALFRRVSFAAAAVASKNGGSGANRSDDRTRCAQRFCVVMGAAVALFR